MGRRWLVATMAAALALAACGDDGEGAADAPGQDAPDGPVVSVIAAFYPLAWASEEIGGDRVSVTDLTPPGVDPHDLELSPDERADIEDADLVVVMGNGFQPAVETAAEDRGGPTVVVFAELRSIDAEGREVAEHDHGHEEDDAHEEDGGHGHDVDLEDALDPHVWLDPILMAEVVGVVEDALVEVAPDDAQTFETNAADLRDELAGLDGEYEEALAQCDSRMLVSAHDAFSYLADRYDLVAEGVAGISPDAEPDAARLADLTDLVEAEGVTTIFTEELVSPAIAETLASEAGVDTDVLSTLEGLTPEAEDAGEDYLSVMRANLAAIRDGLGCS